VCDDVGIDGRESESGTAGGLEVGGLTLILVLKVLVHMVTDQTKVVAGPSLCLIGPWSRQ
jgi:hypothetical protein